MPERPEWAQRAVAARVVQTMPVVLWAMDDSGVCTLSTGRGLDAMGLAEGELVGVNLFEAMADQDAPIEDYRRGLRGDAFRTESVWLGRTYTTWYQPEWSDDGAVVGLLGLSLDTTDETVLAGLAQERLRSQGQLLQYLLDIDAEDRRAVAQQLHDDVIQVLTGLGIRMDMLRELAKDVGAKDLRYEVEDLGQAVRSAIERLRALVSSLEPAALTEKDLPTAMRDLTDVVVGQSGVDWEFRVEHDRVPDPMVEQLLLRVAEEALSNVRVHAQARHVQIELTGDDAGCELVILDDGVGSPHGYVERPGHRGLRGMRERLELAGGTLSVTAAQSGGTRVVARVPNRQVTSGPLDARDVSRAFQEMLDASTEGFAAYDRDWRVIFVNNKAAALMDMTPQQIRGAVLWDLYPPDLRSAGYHELMRAMNEQVDVVFRVEFHGRALEVRAFPSPLGLLAVTSDRTEQEDLRRRLDAVVARTGRSGADAAS